jgi:hypothetical protein
LQSGSATDKTFTSYREAVDALAYSSASNDGTLIASLLILGGFAGVIGVQVRSITNFVGHACFKKDIDLAIWWPYYLLRPVTGFVLGAILVIVVQAGIFRSLDDTANTTLAWVSLAFLAGFGEEEFSQRLRLLSKTLFGEATTKEQGTAEKAAGAAPASPS